MAFITLQLVFLLFPPYPERTSVPVTNHLQSASITSVYILLPNSDFLLEITIDEQIEPEQTEYLSFPWGYISRVIFLTDTDDVYYWTGFPASSAPDTLAVSLSRKEFGGVFDRVFGSSPILFRNGSDALIASVHVDGPSVPEGNILGNNPLMPGEYLRLWVDSPGWYTIQFSDPDGHMSNSVFAHPDPDTVLAVTNSMFNGNAPERYLQGSGPRITVANCLSSIDICTIELFDDSGFSVFYADLAQNPLKTWERISLCAPVQPTVVACTDNLGRFYSLTEPNSESGSYDFNLLALDFDFSFSEGF